MILFLDNKKNYEILNLEKFKLCEMDSYKIVLQGYEPYEDKWVSLTDDYIELNEVIEDKKIELNNLILKEIITFLAMEISKEKRMILSFSNLIEDIKNRVLTQYLKEKSKEKIKEKNENVSNEYLKSNEEKIKEENEKVLKEYLKNREETIKEEIFTNV